MCAEKKKTRAHRSHLTGARARGVRRVRSLGAEFRPRPAHVSTMQRSAVAFRNLFSLQSKTFPEEIARIYIYIYKSLFPIRWKKFTFIDVHSSESMKFIMDNKWKWYLIVHELDCVHDEDRLIKTMTPKFEALFYR